MAAIKRDLPVEAKEFLDALRRRYGDIDLQMIRDVLLPIHVPIRSYSPDMIRGKSGNHWYAKFTVAKGLYDSLLIPGRTGKFVPRSYVEGTAPWRELAKGRIVRVEKDHIEGEIHFQSRARLLQALKSFDGSELFEVDRYGAAAKIESGLAEAAFARLAEREGCTVQRMPEDIALHLGTYYNYDFLVTKGSQQRRVEVKSLWGTDTRYARLIHSKSVSTRTGKGKARGEKYETSSCKFASQDIFAVNLWLRTGNIADFAFARSVRRDKKHPYGFDCAKKGGVSLTEYVTQNPLCEVDYKTWFPRLSDVWE